MKNQITSLIDLEVSETAQLLKLMRIAMEECDELHYLEARSSFVTALYMSEEKLDKATQRIGLLPNQSQPNAW